jgi:hypothetical protein
MTRKKVIHVPRPMIGVASGTFAAHDDEEDGRGGGVALTGFGLVDGSRPNGRATIVEANPRAARSRMTIARACKRGLGACAVAGVGGDGTKAQVAVDM